MAARKGTKLRATVYTATPEPAAPAARQQAKAQRARSARPAVEQAAAFRNALDQAQRQQQEQRAQRKAAKRTQGNPIIARLAARAVSGPAPDHEAEIRERDALLAPPPGVPAKIKQGDAPVIFRPIYTGDPLYRPAPQVTKEPGLTVQQLPAGDGFILRDQWPTKQPSGAAGSLEEIAARLSRKT